MKCSSSSPESNVGQPINQKTTASASTTPKKPSKKSKKPEPLSQQVIEDHLVRFLQRRKLRLTGWERVPKDAMAKDLKLVGSNGYGSQNLILGIDRGINAAEILNVDGAAFILRDFLLRLDEHKFSDFYVTHKRAVQIIEAWRSGPAELPKMPKLLGFKSDPELVMNRLDFDPVECTEWDLEEKAPTFSNMMDRMKQNAPAFMASVGSIFDPHADRKQAVWVYGEKDAGKSQIIYLLEQLCRNSFAVVGAQDYRDKNFKAQFLNKRIAIVLEASAGFIRNDVFKSLTGDGVHPINQKYMPTFNADLPVLIFCFSNNAPEIPMDDSLIERVIACKMLPLERDCLINEHEIQGRLRAELPVIIGACLSEYRLLGASTRIPCNGADLLEAVDSFEEKYVDWLENTIQEDPAGIVTLAELNRLLRSDGLHADQDIGRVKRVLMSRYKVTRTRRDLCTGGKDEKKIRAWVYTGISLREHVKKFQQAATIMNEDGTPPTPSTRRSSHLRSVE